ncbi:hypothetical protein FJZ33_11530 [Candidatus Poribacteria bacterium]|nr:hypothetical protein [Candidatus Poribacteria bacterium]
MGNTNIETDIIRKVLDILDKVSELTNHKLFSLLPPDLPPKPFKLLRKNIDGLRRNVLNTIWDIEKIEERIKNGDLKEPKRKEGFSPKESISQSSQPTQPEKKKVNFQISKNSPNIQKKSERKPPSYISRFLSSTIVRELIARYNMATEEPIRKSEFMNKYQAIRVGVINSVIRRQNLGIPPVFQSANDGDYYAVKVDGQSFYLVLPRFDLIFDELSYGPGAMGEVFECPNYHPQYRYRLKVKKPAIFDADSGQKQWKIIERGRLDLDKVL